MSPVRLVVDISIACLVTAHAAAHAAPAASPGDAQRTPLKLVHQVPVTVPSVQNPDLKPVQVELDAVVAADGAVADLRLVSVRVVSPKVEMTVDPGILQQDFDAMVRAASDAVRQWRFEPPADAPAIVRVPVRFDTGVSQTTLGTIRPLSGYPPNVGPILPRDILQAGDATGTPRKLVSTPPTYPQEAIDAKVQGVVVLDVLLDADGVPIDVQVARSVPMLDAAAIAAVRTWRYEPTRVNGVPVPMLITVSVNFSLDERRR